MEHLVGYWKPDGTRLYKNQVVMLADRFLLIQKWTLVGLYVGRFGSSVNSTTANKALSAKVECHWRITCCVVFLCSNVANKNFK